MIIIMIMITCIKCKRELDESNFNKSRQTKNGYFSYCKPCVKEYNRTPAKIAYNRKRSLKRAKDGYYKKYNASYNKLHPEKKLARDLLNYHLKMGHIKRMPCEICGNVKTQAHHNDYSEKTVVMWLCVKHHREIHNRYNSPN